jgi:hypothetical protein
MDIILKDIVLIEIILPDGNLVGCLLGRAGEKPEKELASLIRAVGDGK